LKSASQWRAIHNTSLWAARLRGESIDVSGASWWPDWAIGLELDGMMKRTLAIRDK
jgi:hypothetical protein